MVKRFIEEKPVKAEDHDDNTATVQMEEEGHQKEGKPYDVSEAA